MKLNLNDAITVSGERNYARNIVWLEQRIHLEILHVEKVAQFTASHTTLLYFDPIPSTIFQCFYHEVLIPSGTWENCVTFTFMT